MVPLQAVLVSTKGRVRARKCLTELLLDHLEDLLLIELLREALDSGQSLTTIALCLLPLAMPPRICDMEGYPLR
jgi:hypothetical protein